MIKNKTLKTILIIFAVITALGVTAGLLGGLRSDGGSSGVKDSHTHDFEVISSVPGTCTTPGSETLQCKSCSKTETRETAPAHVYNDYDICTVCRDTPHELICSDSVSSMYFDDENRVLKIADWNGYQADPGAFLVVFNEGTESEEAFYVLYDGSVASLLYNPEIDFYYNGSEIAIGFPMNDFSAADFIDTISVYQANPNVNYVSFSVPDDIFSNIEIKADGKIVEKGNADKVVIANVSEITVSLINSDYNYMYVYVSSMPDCPLSADYGDPLIITDFEQYEIISFEMMG